MIFWKYFYNLLVDFCDFSFKKYYQMVETIIILELSWIVLFPNFWYFFTPQFMCCVFYFQKGFLPPIQTVVKQEKITVLSLTFPHFCSSSATFQKCQFEVSKRAHNASLQLSVNTDDALCSIYEEASISVKMLHGC